MSGDFPCRGGCGTPVRADGAWCGYCEARARFGALDSFGTLYRNEEGHAVWRIVDRDGNVAAENVASDSDAEWIANRVAGRSGDWINLNVSGVKAVRTRYSDDGADEDESMTPEERAAKFLADLPEFEGTIEEAFEAARQDERRSMAEKWGSPPPPGPEAQRMSELERLADLLDACEPEDDAPVTWGSLRRQVRAAVGPS